MPRAKAEPGRLRPDHPDTTRLVTRLREAVAADGRSRPEIAAAAGLPLPTMHRILAGDRSPKLDMVVRIALGLGKKIRISD